jgi:hypothetical protein
MTRLLLGRQRHSCAAWARSQLGTTTEAQRGGSSPVSNQSARPCALASKKLSECGEGVNGPCVASSSRSFARGATRQRPRNRAVNSAG